MIFNAIYNGLVRYFAAKINSFIKVFIISDALLYSALNVVNILFAVYVTTKVPGGNVQVATSALICGFTVRIAVELLFGRRSSKLAERQKVYLIIFGMVLMSLSYAGFIISHSLWGLAAMWSLNGLGWALAYPAKLALVAKYIKPEQASQEWGATDALNMTLIIITMALGSYIVTHFSYEFMFLLAAAVNTLGLLPYIYYVAKVRNNSQSAAGVQKA